MVLVFFFFFKIICHPVLSYVLHFFTLKAAHSSASLFSLIKTALLQVFHHPLPRHPSPRPGGLEVEAAGDGVDVEDLAGEEEAGDALAFEAAEVHFVEGHAAGGDELLFEGAFAVDGQAAFAELRNEGIQLGLAEVSPVLFRVDSFPTSISLL